MTVKKPCVAGINHLTLAVADLDRSVSFYRDVLGLELRAIWPEGAYLEAGKLWVCLSLDPKAKYARRDDYTHLAFDVTSDDFDAFAAEISSRAQVWKENRSEGASLYFLDPDGHKLELHVGSLASRMEHYRLNPAPDRRLFD